MPYKRTTVFTRKDLIELCAAADPRDYTRDPVVSSLRPAFTRDLRDREFAVTFADGGSIRYRFDRFGLAWREPGGDWQEEACQCLASTRPGVYLVHHLRTHLLPYEAATLVIDEKARTFTMVCDRLGKASQTRDVDRAVRPGWFGGEKPDFLPETTEDLVGKVIDWKLSDAVYLHTIYCNSVCLAFGSPAPAEAPGWADFFATFNPTKYVKLGEGLYLTSFYAPWASGMEVTMLLDLDRMRALGAAFGFDSTDKFCSYTFGAKGAYAPMGFLGSFTVE